MADHFSVDTTLRAWIDAASSSCKDRIAFYNALDRDGPVTAYRIFSNRAGINRSWLPIIRKHLNVPDPNEP